MAESVEKDLYAAARGLLACRRDVQLRKNKGDHYMQPQGEEDLACQVGSKTGQMVGVSGVIVETVGVAAVS
jgi:hypothetical protein